MKKTYLNTVETIREAMNCNKNFEKELYERFYDDASFLQGMLLDDFDVKGLKYHDYYSSFFYTVEDRKAFFESTISNKDFIQEMGISEELANKIMKANEHFEYEMSWDNKQYDNLDNWLEAKAEEIKTAWETTLKWYEDAQFDTDFQNECLERYEYDYKDYFVIDNDYSQIYEHINAHYVKAHDKCVY